MKVSRLFEGGERRVKRKALPRIMVTMFLIGMLRTMSSVRLVGGWSNGGYSADPSNPDYGTHDWIAQHALDWLPTQEKQYILDNLAAYLYGTELPDNGGAPDGIGDTTKHHIYYNPAEVMTDDAAAVRASIEYSNTLNFLKAKDYAKAAKNAGIMSHYIVDVAVFGHVMGSSTEWGAEAHHSEYETYVNEQTSSYSGEFNSYLSFDGSLTAISAYDCAKDLAFDTTFDVDGDLTCVWMDQNYDWSNPTFKNRAGESLNLAVNYLTDVLYTLYLDAVWTVDDDGPADFHTIQEAINAANPGDTIYVFNGTYYEHSTTPTWACVFVNKSLTLIGENKRETIIDGNGRIAFEVQTNNVSITGFQIQNSDVGVRNYVEARNVRVINNIISNNSYGIEGDYFTVTANEIKNSSGMGMSLGWNNTVSGNIVTNNHIGFALWGGGNVLRDNVMLSNEFNFGHMDPTLGWSHPAKLRLYTNDIDTSNTVEGKPIYYWINQHNKIIPSDAGYVELVNSSNIVIENLTLSNNIVGIVLANSQNIRMKNLNISYIWDSAIALALGSCDNIITNNELTLSNFGVFLSSISPFLTENNTILNNDITGFKGIWLRRSDYNNIFNNYISYGEYGVRLELSSKNTFSGNNVTNNSVAIFLGDSSNNRFHHNNFLNNTKQVYTFDSVNIWDNDYPSGGNYWSDYSGVDEKNGPNQDQLGSEGIGDTPYVIDANNRDRYPLMNPWTQPADTTPPVTTIALSGVLGDNDWFTSEVTVTLSATDDTQVDKTEYSFDNATWITCTTPFTITNEGSTIVYYNSTDKAGNPETTKTKTIKIDKTIPSGAITINNDAAYATSTLVTLTLTTADTTSGVYGVRFSNDGVWDNETWENPSLTKTWKLISGDGPKTVYYQIKDNAGMVSITYSDTLILDTISPTANAGNDQTVSEDTLVAFDGSASQDLNGIQSYTWTFTDVTSQTLTGKNPTYTFATPGTYTITLKVTDPAGNSAADTVIITILDITKPIANAGQDQTVNVGAKVNFDASGSSDNVGITSYEWDFGDETKGTGKTTTHTYANTGTYAVKLTVKDEAGNTATDTIIIKVLQTEAFPTWVIGVAVAAIAIAAATILFLKKRK